MHLEPATLTAISLIIGAAAQLVWSLRRRR